MKDYFCFKDRRWCQVEGSQEVWMKELLGIVSERLKVSRILKFWKWNKLDINEEYFKDGEIRIIKIFLVVRCKFCVSFVIFQFIGVL